jgi:hypothetical protein
MPPDWVINFNRQSKVSPDGRVGLKSNDTSGSEYRHKCLIGERAPITVDPEPRGGSRAIQQALQ